MIQINVTKREHTMLLIALRTTERFPDIAAYSDACEWLLNGEQAPTNAEWGKLAEQINTEHKDVPDAQAVREDVPAEIATRFREQAKNQYEREGEIEIDDNAVVSYGDDPGAYVQGWLWVYSKDAGIEESCDYCGYTPCACDRNEVVNDAVAECLGGAK